MPDSPEARLAALGIALPTPAVAVANYVPAVEVGGLLFISGQLPLGASGLVATGLVGAAVSLEEAQAAARLCAVNVLAQARAALGSLDRITRIAKLTGFVATAPGFSDAHKVINGASDLFVSVFGDSGRHARSAVGVASLPLDAPVEVEAILAVR